MLASPPTSAKEYRRNGVASTLLLHLAKWFVQHESYKICVDPGNETACDFLQKKWSCRFKQSLDVLEGY